METMARFHVNLMKYKAQFDGNDGVRIQTKPRCHYFILT